MESFIAAFFAFAFAMFGLSVGVVFNKKPIKGHCGSPSLETGCIKDKDGNKIAPCSTCDCEV